MKPTTDEVLKWAMESGMDDGVSDLSYPLSMFEKFSALAFAAGAAEERARCMHVIEKMERLRIYINDCSEVKMGRDQAKGAYLRRLQVFDAIRALGDDDE